MRLILAMLNSHEQQQQLRNAHRFLYTERWSSYIGYNSEMGNVFMQRAKNIHRYSTYCLAIYPKFESIDVKSAYPSLISFKQLIAPATYSEHLING